MKLQVRRLDIFADAHPVFKIGVAIGATLVAAGFVRDNIGVEAAGLLFFSVGVFASTRLSLILFFTVYAFLLMFAAVFGAGSPQVHSLTLKVKCYALGGGTLLLTDLLVTATWVASMVYNGSISKFRLPGMRIECEEDVEPQEEEAEEETPEEGSSGAST